MALPASFAKDGFGVIGKAKRKRLLVGTEGQTDTGKTEFILSAPGPGIVLALDRMFDGTMDNPNPPDTRRNDYIIHPIRIPLVGTEKHQGYVDYWLAFYEFYKKALANPDAVTVGLDGDSDSWELQRLAEFGKLQQVPSIMYTAVNASRRAMIARAWDAGKIFIATNKIKDVYIDEIGPNGQPVLGNDGKPRRVKSGEQEAQGFGDTEYLWHIRLRHLYKPSSFNKILKKDIPHQWGIRILKCKANRQLEGEELWGSDCNFRSLVEFVYPNIPVSEWGY